MKPDILLWGLILFFLCFGVHILIWRFRHPKRHALALMAIFFAPCIAFVILLGGICPHLSNVDLFAIALLHVAISCAYIQLYPASQANSPSMQIMTIVQKSMPRGISVEEIQSLFDPMNVFDARVNDLLAADLICENAGKLSLTGRGHVLIVPFILYRRTLGIPEGKG